VYVFVREDLSTPQQVVQACHAVIQAVQADYQSFASRGPPHLVVFGVRGERQLDRVLTYLKQHDIPAQRFYEPDISEHTAIATVPLFGEHRRKLRKFQLLKERKT